MPALDGLKASAPLDGWVMAINNYSKKQDAAWDFIKWANSKKAQKQFVLAGGPPSRLSQLEDPELKQKFQGYPMK
jgi:multiple sugar transport system substrate-binding protein